MPELGHLGEAAADSDALHGMLAQIFQHAAHEIAHLDQRHIGQAEMALQGLLGGAARGARQMIGAHGAGHINAAMDRADPGRAGKGRHDARGAQNRQAADDAKAPVQRALGDLLPAGNGDFDFHIIRPAKRRSGVNDGLAHHVAGHGIDGGLARRQSQPRPCDRADPFACPEGDARAGRAGAHSGENQRAMGDIGIIPRILDDARLGEARALLGRRQREGDRSPIGQVDAHGIGKGAAHQRLIGGAGCGGGAGARRPASAQWSGVRIVHGRIHSESAPIREETLVGRARA